MFIRSPTPTDQTQANALVAGYDGCNIDASIPNCDDQTRFRRTLIVEAVSQVVGVGSISSNWLHPTRLTVDVFVAGGSRRKGIGSVLLEHLTSEIPAHDDRSLKASCWSDDAATVAFWSERGFTPIMETHIGTLDFSTQPSVLPSAAILPEAITIVSGDLITPESSLWDDVATLHERVYRGNHAWSPVAPIDLPLAHRIFLDPDDLVPNALFIAIQDGWPLAMASLRALTDEGDCELGWAGGDPDSGEGGRRAARVLVSRCLALAYERGWTVRVEADHADQVLQSVVRDYPLVDFRVWTTYEQQRVTNRQTKVFCF